MASFKAGYMLHPLNWYLDPHGWAGIQVAKSVPTTALLHPLGCKRNSSSGSMSIRQLTELQLMFCWISTERWLRWWYTVGYFFWEYEWWPILKMCLNRDYTLFQVEPKCRSRWTHWNIKNSTFCETIWIQFDKTWHVCYSQTGMPP